MELRLNQEKRKLLTALFLIMLPLLALVLGMIFTIQNGVYFLLSIIWFGLGLVFFVALFGLE
jgi:hypothetical protein